MNVNKQYIPITNKFKDINEINILLDGYEDWIGERLKPNCCYNYKYGIYNYTNIQLLNKGNYERINTLPIAISPDDIEIFSNNDNKNTNFVNIKINYGRIKYVTL